MTKHHIFSGADMPEKEAFESEWENEWFHCGACPCLKDEKDDYNNSAFIPKDHAICKETDSDTIAAMIATGIFSAGYEPDDNWWK